jgi:hypothetical protein
MSLCTVVRLGRPNAGVGDISAGCARDALLPVPPAVGSRSAGNGDMDADFPGLGCSFALFLRWRTLRERWAMDWSCVGWQYGKLGKGEGDSEETSICPLCDGSDHRGEDVI